MASESLFGFIRCPDRGYLLLSAYPISDDPMRSTVHIDSMQCASCPGDCLGQQSNNHATDDVFRLQGR